MHRDVRREARARSALSGCQRPATVSRRMTLTAGAQAGASSRSSARATTDTGSTEVQVALLTARINDLTEHLREHTQGPPLAPRAADARRPRRRLLKYLQRSDLERYRALDPASSASRQVMRIEPGTPAPDFTLADQDGGTTVTLDDLRGPHRRPRLLPVRLQPGLHRPAQRLPGGARRVRGAGRRRSTASPCDSALVAEGVPRAARRHDPAALRLRAQGRGLPGVRRLPSTSAASTQRALVIIEPDGIVDVELPGADARLELPGANLIFDALERLTEPRARAACRRSAPTTTSAGRGRPAGASSTRTSSARTARVPHLLPARAAACGASSGTSRCASKHPRARRAGRAPPRPPALQGRFWEMHDSLLADQGHLDDPHLWARAERARPRPRPLRGRPALRRGARSASRATSATGSAAGS